ncbi:NUDIX hydrolase [Chromobacterium sp. Beijing]|uniref:NUDIX hydrolase n=1 Tax=Chromobacterium sp. Beijing TaxID=2735795 RepID=UPI001F179D21|nr:NUDIX hydrolase [Chromobacterium sp. Beijing]UJB31747.1 NUDIX hydrolase [Chromobacterium sp. Beijing]
MTQWKPNATVAAVIELDGRYLMVEEVTSDGICFNQPAGHLEYGETLEDAVKREVLEETGWHFRPLGLVGIYLVDRPNSDITYLRFAFYGHPLRREDYPRLDDGILSAQWLSHEDIVALRAQHRSPVVQQCLDDYRAGKRHPLALIHHLGR